MSRKAFFGFFQRLPSVFWIAFFGVFVTAGAWMFVLDNTDRDFEVEMQRINSENGALARTLEEHVARAVKLTDNALLFLKREYEAHGRATERLVNYVQELRQDPLLNQIGLVNARGDLQVSAVPITRPINIAHREHFQVHAAGDGVGLFIAKPLLNMVSGAWSIFLTRRLNGPDGTFAGVLTAGIDPRYFTDYFDAPELGRDRAIFLVGRDGIIRARRFQQVSDNGQDISASPLFKQLQSAAAGTYEGVSPIDGRPKLTSFHAVRGTSLIVAVAELKDAALAPFRKRRQTNYLAALVFTIVTAGFCVLLIRSVRLAGRQRDRLEEDLEERERTAAALQRSENKFRTLFNSVNDSILILDVQGKFLEANEFSCRLLGYSREEMLRLCPKEIDTPEAAQRVQENIRNIMLKGEHQFVSEQLTRDGRSIPVEVSARVIDYEGQTAMLAVCRDITVRKADEERLRQSREFIRSVLDAVDDGFLVIDGDFRIIAANQAFCRQANRSLDEVLGQPCHAVPHPALVPCHAREKECPARKTLETGQPAAALFHQRDECGPGLAAEVKSYPLSDDAGHVQSVIITIRDITERQKMEEQVLAAQKLESVGILAAGIAHDFNNLLGVVLGNVSLARMLLPAGSEPVNLLQKAEEGCEHGRELSGRLLTFSKGGEPLKRTVLLRKTLQDSVLLSLSGSNVSADFSLADELGAVDADEGQLRQVFNNLAINAKEAMPDGGTVEVGAENQQVAAGAMPGLLAGKYVKITFRDHGGGIPRQVVGRVFDPYFSTKEMGSRKGQGLGLTICDSVVKKHGGLITVATELGKGTLFTIYLPASEHDAAKGGGVFARTVAPAQRGEKILVMDDDAEVRNILDRMLKHLGHTADLFPDSAGTVGAYWEALAAGVPYSLVILDLTIQGGKGGAETFRELKEFDPNVRAIISSGYADDPILEHYREHGFAGAITKPYTVEQMKKALASIRRS